MSRCPAKKSIQAGPRNKNEREGAGRADPPPPPNNAQLLKPDKLVRAPFPNLALLVLETGESRYSCFDPRLLVGAAGVVDEVRAVGGQVYPHDEVRRVPGRRKGPSSRQHLHCDY